MVIINYKGGQLGNRMLLFAHFIANSMEYGYLLYNPEFNEYVPFFKGTAGNSLTEKRITVSRFGNRRLDRMFSLLIRGWTDVTWRVFINTPGYRLYRIFRSHDRKHIIFNLNNPAFIVAAQHRKTIVQGWQFRDVQHIEKYHAEISAYFTPTEFYQKQVSKALEKALSLGDFPVGVHIRRGDYARFDGGRYFFTDELYAKKMKEVDILCRREGKKCIFILCTNDTVDMDHFESALPILFEKRHFITDMYILAACKLILGPPSTFSIWASYYGRVPLIQITDKNMPVSEIPDYISRC